MPRLFSIEFPVEQLSFGDEIDRVYLDLCLCQFFWLGVESTALEAYEICLMVHLQKFTLNYKSLGWCVCVCVFCCCNGYEIVVKAAKNMSKTIKFMSNTEIEYTT